MPNLLLIGGPNGAGKSTIAPTLLRDLLGISEFVNADVIARGLSGFDPERAAIQAGRIMLQRLRELAERRVDFAFESTLAGRAFAPWIADIVGTGYRFRLAYVWVPSAELCIARVRGRVQAGGHQIPDDVVRRRYGAGLRNFFNLYRPLASPWQVYDNSAAAPLRLIAEGNGDEPPIVYDRPAWLAIEEGYRDARRT